MEDIWRALYHEHEKQEERVRTVINQNWKNVEFGFASQKSVFIDALTRRILPKHRNGELITYDIFNLTECRAQNEEIEWKCNVEETDDKARNEFGNRQDNVDTNGTQSGLQHINED